MQVGSVIAAVVGVLGLAAVVAMNAGTPSAPQQQVAAPPPAYNSAQAPAAAGQTAVKPDDIREFAMGKTMAEIRDKWGPPSNVEDQSIDGIIHWFYWSERLPVVDPDAGILLKNSTDFVFDIGSKRVIEVRVGV